MGTPEQRDPSGATLPLRWLSVGMPMAPRWNADNAVTHGLYANSLLYRAIRVKAEAVAGLPFRAGPQAPDRLGGTAEHDPSARLARLLGPAPGGPAPKLPARRLIAWSLVQMITTGRFAWELEMDAQGGIVAIWPLVSARLETMPSRSGSAWWTGFRYGPEGIDKRRLSPEQVFYYWNPSARDFREPESPLEAGRYDISVANALDRYSFAFLKNDARPASVVTTHAFGDPDQFEAWKRQWTAEYGGPDNAGGVLHLEVEDDGSGDVSSAIDVQNVGLSQQDAQMLETYQQKVDNVTMLLGVPRSMLGDASGRTFANAEAEEKVFWRVTMPYPIGDLEDALNMELAPRLGMEVGWFDASRVEALQTPPKPVTAPVGAPELVRARMATIDEGRADYGLPPLPDGQGDRLMTVDEIAAMTPGAVTAPPAVGRSTPILPTQREARVAVDSEGRRAKVWGASDAHWRQLEGMWTRALRRLFERQRDATMKRIRGPVRGKAVLGKTAAEVREAADGYFDPVFWQQQTEDEIRALYESVASGALTRVTDQFGIAFDLEAEFVQRFIEDRTNQLAGIVTDTTYEAIQEALVEGVGAGESTDDLAARVADVFDQASDTRAELIARTEVISASNGASMEAVGTLGPDVVAGAEWVAARDSRTRDSHASADGQVVPIGQPFSVGGATLFYPGDPTGPPSQTVQCRCAVAFLTPEEMTPEMTP